VNSKKLNEQADLLCIVPELADVFGVNHKTVRDT
jgi:hypothetical protein